MSEPTYAEIAARLRRWSKDMLAADGTADDKQPTGLSLIRAMPFSLGMMAVDIEYLEQKATDARSVRLEEKQ